MSAPDNRPGFAAWSHDNLARFAHEVETENRALRDALELAQAENAQLTADVHMVLTQIRQLIKEAGK